MTLYMYLPRTPCRLLSSLESLILSPKATVSTTHLHLCIEALRGYGNVILLL